MAVLSVVVDEREVVFCGGNCAVRLRFTFQTEVRETAVDEDFPFGFERPLQFEFNSVDCGSVERGAEIASVFRRGEERSVWQIEPHRAFFARIESDSGVHRTQREIDVTGTCLVASAAGNVHGETHLAIRREVFDVDCEEACFGEVEFFSCGRSDQRARIPFRRARDETDSLFFEFRGCAVAGLDLFRRELQFRGESGEEQSRSEQHSRGERQCFEFQHNQPSFPSFSGTFSSTSMTTEMRGWFGF